MDKKNSGSYPRLNNLGVTTENGSVLIHMRYMVHTWFIGLYVNIQTLAQ